MEASAQDVIEALRYLQLNASRDEIVDLLEVLLSMVPEADSDGGFTLITNLLAEGVLKVVVNS